MHGIFAGNCFSNGKFHKNVGIIIEKNCIKNVIHNVTTKTHSCFNDCVKVTDLSHYTVLPGLIDCHVHPFIEDDDYQFNHVKYDSAYKSLRAVPVLQQMLLVGFTTVRIAGDADVGYGALALQKASSERLLLLPRIVAAAHYLSVTGGGGDINSCSHEQNLISDGRICNGVDEFTRAVREEIKHGSKWIKILASGAFMSSSDSPSDVHFSDEELNAVLSEAKRRNVPVMAHAHSGAAILKCVHGGVRSIEHGTFITAEGIDAMATRRDCWLVPTLFIGDYYLEKAEKDAAKESQQKMVELSKKFRKLHVENVRACHRAGVRIACGSDFVGWSPSESHRELLCLAECGLSTEEALRSATIEAADLLQLSDQIGDIGVGLKADIIAVAGTEFHLNSLSNVAFVMFNGKIEKEAL